MVRFLLGATNAEKILRKIETEISNILVEESFHAIQNSKAKIYLKKKMLSWVISLPQKNFMDTKIVSAVEILPIMAFWPFCALRVKYESYQKYALEYRDCRYFDSNIKLSTVGKLYWEKIFFGNFQILKFISAYVT